MGPSLDAGGLPGPTDAWTTLAGLARDTTSIRLGTMVTSATFRLPGPLAITVAGVDQMSGGRVELGLGAGWYEREHQAYAIPFPPLGERFDRLEEQLAVITGLWRTPVGETFDFDGRHYQVTGSPALPKPVQDGGVPVIVGGGGPKRTPDLAARFAAEYNAPFMSMERFAEQRQRVVAACEAIGRDPVDDSHDHRPGRVPRRRRGGVRPARRGDWSSSHRPARRRHCRHSGRVHRRLATLVRRRRLNGSICKCSTSPISIISTPSPRSFVISVVTAPSICRYGSKAWPQEPDE